MTVMTIVAFIGHGGAMGSQNWTVAEARTTADHYQEWAYRRSVVGAQEWERKTKRTGNLAEFFAEYPLRESGLKVRRLKERPRKISL